MITIARLNPWTEWLGEWSAHAHASVVVGRKKKPSSGQMKLSKTEK